MKEYNKPIISDEELEIVDVIAKSYGIDQAGDTLVDFLGEQNLSRMQHAFCFFQLKSLLQILNRNYR